VLLVAGVLLAYATQYFSEGEATLPPDIDAPTQQNIEQAIALATEESNAEIQPSSPTSEAQESALPAEENQGLAEVREQPPVVEAPSLPPSVPVIEEVDHLSDSATPVEDAEQGTGVASTDLVASAEPEPISEDMPAEEAPEQTFLIKFPFDSDELIPDSHHVLDNALVMLKENPDSVASITGFTDNRGDKQYNIALSIKRANAVQQYLVSAGIARERLTVEGRGILTDPIDGVADEADSMQPFRIVQIKVGAERPL
jgi:outer membrane protein OmpA-like peptidoglycan-associated protein